MSLNQVCWGNLPITPCVLFQYPVVNLLSLAFPMFYLAKDSAVGIILNTVLLISVEGKVEKKKSRVGSSLSRYLQLNFAN